MACLCARQHLLYATFVLSVSASNSTIPTSRGEPSNAQCKTRRVGARNLACSTLCVPTLRVSLRPIAIPLLGNGYAHRLQCGVLSKRYSQSVAKRQPAHLGRSSHRVAKRLFLAVGSMRCRCAICKIGFDWQPHCATSFAQRSCAWAWPRLQ